MNILSARKAAINQLADGIDRENDVWIIDMIEKKIP